MARKRYTSDSNEMGEPPSWGTFGEKTSKMEAVRRTLNAGVDNPTEGVAYVLEHYGHAMPTSMFSAYKSQIRNKGKKRGRRRRGGRPAAAPAATHPARARSGGSSPLE